jgi:hypothetical protein
MSDNPAYIPIGRGATSPEFVALRENVRQKLENGEEPPHIRYQDIYAFIPGREEDPAFKQEVIASLEYLEHTDFGQETFRGILLNEDRHAPIMLVISDSDGAGEKSPVMFQSSMDALVFLPRLLDNETAQAIREEQGLTSLPVIINHESNHAATIDFDHIPNTPEEVACYEEKAMIAEQAVQQDLGLPQREQYFEAEKTFDALFESLPEEKFQRLLAQGLDDDSFKSLKDLVTQFTIINAGCEGMDPAQAAQQAGEVIQHALTQHGIEVSENGEALAFGQLSFGQSTSGSLKKNTPSGGLTR